MGLQQATGFSVMRFTSLNGIQGEKGRKGGEPTFSQRKCSCGFEMFVFHSCGWRFSGFSEVNAGSAPCHQIRFTVTLATVFTAHWLPRLPLLPATSAASWRQLGATWGWAMFLQTQRFLCLKSLPFKAPWRGTVF